MSNLSRMNLWRWSFEFLLRRRDRVDLGGRIRRGHRLGMWRRHGIRSGRRDIPLLWFYLLGRFWSRKIRWSRLQGRGRRRYRLLLLIRRCRGVRSRRSMGCIILAGR